ncbi:hypothetical protein PFMALIP_05910 [Plasmodium falciparum MaliPS096_E11]|uniref:Duffy-binding-like domain-containing protein n=1 Tax=Plasmodium falciparum MaliPS096_E11 TaxID=1036727 RepID=A0A024WFX2_PLAFA|nr:hypothetical protein PFMALIP_05910 [Plasmodium falciparum MaliPS096_E11]
MAPQNGGGGSSQDQKDKPDYTNVKDARELFDRIGGIIQQQVHNAAKTYTSELKGDLSRAKFDRNQSGQQTLNDPCKLDYQYHTNVKNSGEKEHPCRKGTEKRFSDVGGAECDKKKISGSIDNEGACAPYRRLHLCDYNLENINDYENITNDTLLVDVCLAAKHEGNSINTHYPKYQIQYASSFSTSQICTVLARSFADIGDIIRGRDLYRRDKGKRDELEENLKTIFGIIYNNLFKKKGEEAQKRYNDEDKNFFKLREDWWALNRKEVWKAITCDAPDNAKYKVIKPDGSTKDSTWKKCRDVLDVSTNFDYVPQFLRWFEEWAEDFCRKRKHKLQNAIEKCRGKDGKERYCSRNGYDCTKTVRAKRELVKGYDCHKCSVACTNFVPWIKNQKQEFEKQKGKYTKEMQKYSNEASNGKIINTYEKEFYKELKKNYENVESFLKKLNNEAICKKPTAVEKEKASNVDFNNEKYVKTFDHKEYCDTCPWCAKKVKQNGNWTDEQYHPCPLDGITPLDNKEGTNIKILTPDRTKSKILDKYSKLCEKGDKDIQMEKWKCHYEERNDYVQSSGNDYCVLQDGKANTKDETIMSYEAFFEGWVTEMLDESIQWRTEYKNCINKEEATKCHDGCKTPCECFLKWVVQKEEEWNSIEQHFDKQKDIKKEHRYVFLKAFLQLFFFEQIKKAYGDKDESKELMEKLKKIEGTTGSDTEHSNDPIKILLEHEKGEAKKCKENNPDKCKEQATSGLARSLDGPQSPPAVPVESASDDEVEEAETAEEVCEMVKKFIRDNHENDKIGECKKKDFGGNSYPDWKCGDADLVTDDNVCMPPRRQKLCVHFLANDNEIKKLQSQVILREAFIKSAAAETFLAWYYYKSKDSKGNELDNTLKAGTIPPEFLRSMFYTYGDYRDFLFGTDISKGLGEGTALEKQINILFPNGVRKIPNEKTREKWWTDHGPEIWKGMLCALEKASGDKVKFTNNSKYSYTTVTFSGDNSTTLEEFAKRPQFLRWMTEWAEWYCKAQKEEYEELERKCGECKDKGADCWKGTQECTECDKQCRKYKTFVDTWQKQWNKIFYKYLILYRSAKTTSRHGTAAYSGDVGEKDKPVVAFLQELQKQNSGKTTYDTAAGYIHQEAHISDCKIQTDFCDKKNGGKKDNKEYAFRPQPHDHDTACKCNENTPSAPPEPKDKVNPCDIVDKLFTNGDPQNTFKDACEQKYSIPNRYWGWKCIPTKPNGDSTRQEGEASNRRVPRSANSAPETAPPSGTNQGSICIPPRRRKLYVGKLEQWAKEQTQLQTQVEGSSEQSVQSTRNGGTEGASGDQSTSESGGEKTPSDNKLLEAFIESAAVETFFLWHKYKMDKEIEKKEKNRADGELFANTSYVGEELQNDLEENGEIPEEFKRQMFYTLGDYRDILFSGSKDDKNGGNNIILNASGNKEDMEKIQKKIKEILPTSGNKENSFPPNSGQPITREKWWNDNVESIWNAMVYALTYTEKSVSGGEKNTTITQDPNLKSALWDDDTKKPQKHQYNSVKLEDDTGAKPTEAPTRLSEFVKRPTYFRWLEEWGEEFCRKQKHKLEIIRVECRGKEDGDKNCSGYGENCDDNLLQNYTNFPDFNCPGCGTSCSFYKKWIKKKRREYDEQSNAYNTELQNAKNNEDYKQFCATQGTSATAAAFLHKLGPCKKDSGEGNGKDILDFDKPDETFRPAENCKPCSKFNVNCKNADGNCDNSKGQDCESKTHIEAKDIKNGGNSAEDIDMLVSDNSPNGFEDDLDECLLPECADAGIFEGIRKDVWLCGNVCGYNVCKPKNVNGKQNQNQIIIIKALFKRWLEYFLQDYNKIRTKLKPCMKNGEGLSCKNKCKDKCTCVKAWIDEKSTEWTNIKKHYKTQNKDDIKTFVSNILRSLQPQTELNKAIKPCKDLDKFESFCGLNSDKPSQNGHQDAIGCMLEKLQEKATSCQKLPIGSPQAKCVQPSTQPDDEEDLTLEETENQVKPPNICPKVEEPKTVVEVEKCEATATPKEPAPTEPSAGPKPEEEAPAPEVSPTPPTIQPPQADQPTNSISDILSSTIPFGIAIALTSIVNHNNHNHNNHNYNNHKFYCFF